MELTTQKQDQLVALCQNLISIPSVTGQEEKLALFIKEKMLGLGFDKAWIDDVGNVIGVVKGKKPGQKVLFDGHLDTVEVPSPETWRNPPFKGKVVDSKIYGRGASDMKGALAAMIFAVAELAAHKEELCGEIYVSGTVHEEIAEGVSLGLIIEKIRPDVVVIGEATQLKINIGQRGRGEIVVKTIGKAAHSSNPEVGVNAVYQMTKAIQAIQGLKLPADELLGPAILELTDIISSPYPGASVVPEKCLATYDRRLLVGDTLESIVEDIEKELAKISSSDPDFKAEVSVALNDYSTYTGFKVQSPRFAPAWKMEKDHPVVLKAKKAMEEAKLPFVLGAYSFCTNGSSSAGIHGIPTIGFGPGRESEAHITDEYLELDQLIKSAIGYYHLAKNLGA
jgi:putative selenium metabolism hydrolase